MNKLISAFASLPRLAPVLMPVALPLAVVALLLGAAPTVAWWLFVGAFVLPILQEIAKGDNSEQLREASI